MKLDKEYLAKHHFWFLLAVYTPLVLVGLIILWTSVAGAIDKEAQTLKKLKDEVKNVNKPDVKNRAWIEAFKQKAENLAKQKNKVWDEVWRGQAAIFTWPEPLSHLQTLEYGEPIVRNEDRDTFVNDKDCYRKEVKELVSVVQPVNDKGEGVVQFGASNDWRQVLSYNRKWLDSSVAQKVPSSEDIWLAQEDLWIQRELLQVIRDTNDGLAIYEKVAPAPKPAKDEIDRQVFENPRWRLELAVTKDQLRWRITNRSPRQQTVAQNFRVTFRPQRAELLWVDGDPLAPNQTSKEVVVDFKGFPGLRGIDRVEQVLDWRTAPVKRVDQLRLAANAHSTSGKQLVPFPKFAPKDDDPAAAGGPGGPGVVPPPGGMQGGPGPGMVREGFGPGLRPNADEMGLIRNRYIETSDQVRRMPVGLVLIVDQSHVQDVLTAFAKSRLRFQTTQVEWKRYRGAIQPVVHDEKVVEGEVGPGMKRRPPGPNPGAIGFRPPPVLKPGTNPKTEDPAENDEDSSNLVELALYGITSLYAKYPPKSATPADAGATVAAPGAPAGAPAPTPAPAPAPAPVVPAPAPSAPKP